MAFSLLDCSEQGVVILVIREFEATSRMLDPSLEVSSRFDAEE